MVDTSEIEAAFQLFLDTHPNVLINEEDAVRLANYILDNNLNPFRAGSYWKAYEWLKSEESGIAAQKRQAQLDRQEFFRPSSETRAELLSELRKNQAACAKTEFTPERVYSDEEIERMSSDEMREKVFGIRNIDKRQGSGGITLRPERPGERRTATTLRGMKRRGVN
jgi:hypothetical protein